MVCFSLKHTRIIFTVVILAFPLTAAIAQESNVRPLRAVKPNAVRVSEATGIKTRGYGPNRGMLISGRVFDSSGQPAEDFQLQVDLRTGTGRHSLKPTMRGHEYEVWLPIGGTDVFYVMLFAESHDGTSIAFEGISKQTLRRAAIDGFDLMLKQTDRPVEVKVTDDGRPVAGAHVTSLWGTGLVRQSTTDSRGMVSVRVRREENLSQLTVWTDDFRLGGYMLSRDPVRDPSLNEYHVELDDCREETIRFVNAEDGTPVPRVNFALIVGTGEPNYNFPGTSETLPQATMTTDENGEAVYRWFPDWEKHGSYVESDDPRWVLADTKPETLSVGEGMLFRVKPRTTRKTLHGKVTSEHLNVGHLFVEAWSFQGEIDDRSDVKCVFTDEQGNFSIDCLPGATYCVFVNDDTYVSNIIDLIPYNSETGETNSATLHLSEGQPVEVRATVGPSHQLLRKQWISFSVPHDFFWMENGEKKYGSSGRRWQLRTGFDGIARTHVLPGAELEVSIYENDWRVRKNVVVKEGEPTRVEIHRAIAGKREVSGQLVLPAGLEADLAGAVLEVGSIDGQTKDRQTIKADDRGHFSFETPAIDIGFFAYTADGKAAAVAKLKQVNKPVELKLLPTFDQSGRILGKDDQPLAGQPVRATITLDGGIGWQNAQYNDSFTAKTFETRTDNDGHFTLRGLPREVSCGVNADAIDDPNQKTSLGSIGVELGEKPEPLVGLLSRPSAPQRTLVEKYVLLLRYATLGDYYAMVLIYDRKDKPFVAKHLLDSSQTEEVAAFYQMNVTEDQLDDAANVEFAKAQNWPSPEEGIVFAVVLDQSGKELARTAIDLSADNAAAQAADFVRKQAPPRANAREKWDKAFAEAKRTNRKVWVRICQRYCGPCYRLSGWMDDQRELLEQDYVLLKIDDVRDLYGVEIAQRLVDEKWSLRQGVPYHAIFDPNQKRLIDSKASTGNIGFPSEFDGRRHLRKMLDETRSKLTPKQVDQLVESVTDE